MKDCERESVRHSEKDEENSINDIQRGKKGKTEKQFVCYCVGKTGTEDEEIVKWVVMVRKVRKTKKV